MPSRVIAIAAAALIAGLMPAFAAWEANTDDGGEWAVAVAPDATGIATLEIFCDEVGWVLTVAPDVAHHDDGARHDATLSILVDGAPGFDLEARFTALTDIMAIETDNHAAPRLIDAVRAMAGAAETIETRFLDYEFSFPAQGAAEAVGMLLEGCETEY